MHAYRHVKGLEILSDCEENQKLIQKVPDWLAARWNCQVIVTIMAGKDFPSFEDFANFVTVEAEIACNPITSLHALHSSSSHHDKRIIKEVRGNKATAQVFATRYTNNETGPINVKPYPPCMWCKDNKHQLSKCPDFRGKSLEDRRMYVKDNKLCYGCMKSGHNAKECQWPHLTEITDKMPPLLSCDVGLLIGHNCP